MKKIGIAFSTLFIYTISIAQNPVQSDATLSNATVYYGQGAELQHNAKATLGVGSQEIVISNISDAIDEKTIQIACPENVVLLSSRFNYYTPPVTVFTNPVIVKMQDSIKVLQKQIAVLQNDISIQNEMLDKTAKLVETNYMATTDKTISAAELIKLIDFYNAKIQTIRNTLFALQQKKAVLTDSTSAITVRIGQQHTQRPARKGVGQLILQVMTTAAVNASFDITYFTRRAGWLPAYDLRVKTVDNSFKLVYKATINQTTGIDWKQVKLTLSTGNPNQSSNAPILNALFVNAYLPAVYQEIMNNNRGRLSNTIQSFDRKKSAALQEVVVNGYGTLEKKDLNDEETTEGDLVQAYTTLSESQLNTSFEIDLPYDIPTDGKAYSVSIKDEMIVAGYKHYAVPKLDADAFLLAEISDWESLNLMPGEANIVMDNVYLGKTFIDPNTTADTINISLGRDKRISVKRNLIKDFSKSKTKAEFKTDDFTYELVVKNNKKTAVDLLLKDQYPISKTKEVEITMTDKGNAEVNEELGILNWKIKLAPGESKKFRFSYSVKYPKDKVIRNL